MPADQKNMCAPNWRTTKGEKTKMRYINRTLLLALLALTCLQAQDITKGSITGVVRDASGAVVPGAPVKLTSPYGDHSTTTNGAGVIAFTSLGGRTWLQRNRQPAGIFHRDRSGI